jgi:hypothetical protein
MHRDQEGYILNNNLNIKECKKIKNTLKLVYLERGIFLALSSINLTFTIIFIKFISQETSSQEKLKIKNSIYFAYMMIFNELFDIALNLTHIGIVHLCIYRKIN